MMAKKHKRARAFVISLLIYIMAVSVGHSIYAESQISALEKNLNYLVNELAEIQPDLLESTRQRLTKDKK